MKKQTKKLVLSKETVKSLDLVAGGTTGGTSYWALTCGGWSCHYCLEEPVTSP